MAWGRADHHPDRDAWWWYEGHFAILVAGDKDPSREEVRILDTYHWRERECKAEDFKVPGMSYLAQLGDA